MLNKNSSRSGRFKKLLVSEEFLQREAPIIFEKLSPYKTLYDNKEISAAEFCSIYIILTLSYRHPGSWCGAKRSETICSTHNLHYPLSSLVQEFEPNVQKRLADMKTLGDVFNHFSFKSTPLTVQRSILEWSNNNYGLELMFRIPSPKEVLNQQKMGRRCVTIINDKDKAKKLILGERDALGFTMHDLIHADHFYHNNTSFQGQLGFYGFLDFCVNKNFFDDLMNDINFLNEFEYLIADMNAYPVHLLKCFKSALVHYHPLKEEFFSTFINSLDCTEKEKKALGLLNVDDDHEEIHQILLNLIERYRVI